MKLNSVRMAVAAACALAGSSAFALPQGSIDPANPGPNDIIIHYAGATAQLNTVSALAAGLCTAASIDTYNNKSGNSAANGFPNSTHRTITCTLLSGAPVPAAIQGKNLYFSYQQNGGSIFGVTPVIDQINLPMMKVFGNTSCTGAHPTFTCDNGNNSAAPLVATSDQYLAKPVAGGSDVEPAMFTGSNIAGLTFGAPTGTNFVTQQAFDVVFGVAVSCALLDHTIYTSCAGQGITSGPIKSLSRDTIASIFAGGKGTWQTVPEFGLDANVLTGVSAGTDIHVCRRKPGSGTQAGAQAYFLNQECGSPSRVFATTAANGARVEEISDSTKVLTECMNVQSAAIGISSTEKPSNATNGTKWAYVRIDGVDPTLQNASFGTYDFMFENSMQYNSAVITSNQLAFISELFTAAQDPSVLVGKPGVLAIPVGSNLPLDFGDLDTDGNLVEFVSGNPVSSVTRGGNACRPEAAVY